MLIKNSIKILLLTSLILLLVSCFHRSPSADVEIHSANYLNPNINGKSAPLEITFFQLKSAYAFNQASYQQLANNPVDTLSTNLLDKQVYIIRPGSTKSYQQNLAPGTRYLGIVASYRKLNHAKWRQLIELPPNKKSVDIQLTLETDSLTAEVEK